MNMRYDLLVNTAHIKRLRTQDRVAPLWLPRFMTKSIVIRVGAAAVLLLYRCSYVCVYRGGAITFNIPRERVHSYRRPAPQHAI